MQAGTVDSEIKKYLPLLGNDEKQSILTVIRSFLNLRQNTDTVDIASYNKEIDEAMGRIDKGEFTTHEEVEREMDSW